jgi:hypothetical protein
MGKRKQKAAKGRSRRPGALTAKDIAAINRGEIETTVTLAGTALPVLPPLRHWTKGQILTWATGLQRGAPIAHAVIDFRAGQQTIEHRPLRPPRVTNAAPKRPRGRPRTDVPQLLQRIHDDLRDYPKHGLRQRARRLHVSRNTLQKYLPLALDDLS